MHMQTIRTVIVLFFSSLFLLSYGMGDRETAAASQSPEQQACTKFSRDLLFLPLHVGTSRTATEEGLRMLQKMASYFFFQNRLMHRIAKMQQQPIETLLENKTLKKNQKKPYPHPEQPSEITDKIAKTHLICEYIHFKIATITKPELYELVNYDFLEQLQDYSNKNYKSIHLIEASSECFIDAVAATWNKLTQLLNFYLDPKIQLQIDAQYQEILKAMRIAITRAARSKTPDDFSGYLFDPYYSAGSDRTVYEFADALISEQMREKYIHRLEERDQQEAMVKGAEPQIVPSLPATRTSTTTRKKKKSYKKSTNQPKKQKKQPAAEPVLKHGLPGRYNPENATITEENQHVLIHDTDNGMVIELDLSNQETSSPLTSVARLSDFYSDPIKSWFANANKKIAESALAKKPLIKRQLSIQKNRFSPLVDNYIRLIGRRSLELITQQPSKGSPLISMIDLDDQVENQNTVNPAEKGYALSLLLGLNHDKLVKWLDHAQRYKLKTRLSATLDAQVTFEKTGVTLPATFEYTINPATEQITARRMRFEKNPQAS
jgi:hypothetical protein